MSAVDVLGHEIQLALQIESNTAGPCWATELRQCLQAKNDAIAELMEAERNMVGLYGSVWDRTDGCLVIFPSEIEKFDATFEALAAALANCKGETK